VVTTNVAPRSSLARLNSWSTASEGIGGSRMRSSVASVQALGTAKVPTMMRSTPPAIAAGGRLVCERFPPNVTCGMAGAQSLT
jgi:hypothetical protein